MTKGRLSVAGVGKTFRAGRRSVAALADVTVEIAPNEFVAIVGVSGCGKSTLLSLVAGLERATEGTIALDGRPVAGPGRDRGLVFQSYSLLPWLDARRNVEFALAGTGLSRRERRRVADEHLEVVGLLEFADAYPSELSGGMRQRVAIARALSYKPRVLLMDEPFGALDAITRQQMQELLTQVWEQHRLTVLFVTHDIEEALFLSDRVLVMSPRPGRIVEQVTVDLPRPRRVEMIAGDDFVQHKIRLLEMVRSQNVATVGAASAAGE